MKTKLKSSTQMEVHVKPNFIAWPPRVHPAPHPRIYELPEKVREKVSHQDSVHIPSPG